MNKFQSFFLKSFGAIKVVRASMQQDYIYQSINTLNRGGVIQIYPEAHFPSTKDHRLQPFKSSYIVMAAQTGAPIIPCYHNANYGLFKRDHVAIGKPIYTKDYFVSSNPTIEQIGLMNKAIESKVRELQKVIEG
jgi:1-acyl-sn-glycerol-3-phosphate acyltransferase